MISKFIIISFLIIHTIGQADILHTVPIDKEINSKQQTNERDNKSILTKDEIAYLKNKKVIKMCSYIDMFPLEKIEGDAHIGVVADIFSILKKDLPVPIEIIKAHTKGENFQNIVDEKCDIKSILLTNSSFFKDINISKPYINDSFIVITKTNKPFIQKLQTHKDKQFIVTFGTYKEFLNEHKPYLNLIVAKNTKEALNLLKNNVAFGFITSSINANHIVQQYGFKELKVNTKIEDLQVECSLGVIKSQPELLKIFNKLIDNISKKDIAFIKAKWGIHTHETVVDDRYIWQITFVFALILAIVLFFLIKQNYLKKQLQEQKEIYEKLYQKSADGILIIENDKFVDCNESVVKMLGYNSKNKILNTHLSQLSPKQQPDGRLSSEKANKMIQIAKNKGTNRFEWVHQKANGEVFFVEIVLTYIELSGKNIIHTMWRDIDDRKKLEEKDKLQSKLLEYQSKSAAIGRLLSMITHQWRQPLSLINGITTKIYHNLDDKYDEIKKDILKIEDTTFALSETISNFNKFYAFDEKKKGIVVKDMIQECIDITFPTIASASKPEFIINEIDQIQINGCCNGLQQCLITLFSNSIDIFSQRHIKDPTIELTIYKKGENCYIEVEDNGGGIDSKHIDMIFDVQFTTNDNIQYSRGFGLNIAKDIIENNLNGKISVMNTKKGAKFTIRYQLK